MPFSGVSNNRSKRVKGIFHNRVQLWAVEFRGPSSLWEQLEAWGRRLKLTRRNQDDFWIVGTNTLEAQWIPPLGFHKTSQRSDNKLPFSLSWFNHISIAGSHGTLTHLHLLQSTLTKDRATQVYNRGTIIESVSFYKASEFSVPFQFQCPISYAEEAQQGQETWRE